MTTRSFKEFAAEQKIAWTDWQWAVYAEACKEFSATDRVRLTARGRDKVQDDG